MVSISQRTYIIVSIIITISMLVYVMIDLCRTREMLLNEKKFMLINIVTTLDRQIDSIKPSLLDEFSKNQSNEEKLLALNRYLQPVLDNLSLEHRGYGIGVYFKDLNVIASIPYSPDFVGKRASTQPLVTYQKFEMAVRTLNWTLTRQGKSVFSVTYPVSMNGTIVGHAWANYTIEDFENELFYLYSKHFFIALLLWLSILLSCAWAFSKIGFSLKAFADDINTGNYNQANIKALPELLPIIQTVESLKKRIEHEFEEKEAVKEQIFRLDRLNLVSQMAAGVAHEIRNPMTTIMGFLQLIHKKANESLKDKIELVLLELKRIDSIITDFLSLARNKVTEKRKLLLNDIIEQLRPLLFAEATKQGIDIVFKLGNELPLLDLDEKEIKQLILNLANNAIQAMGSEGKLIIETFLFNNSVRLSVSDTGCGMSDAVTDKIFDPFYTTKENGTGLGLSICKSIVDRHNANITIKSKSGKGTTVIISFPFQPERPTGGAK